jgi:hypothetical protein
MIPHQFSTHAAECLVDGGDLGQDVCAITVLLDHLLESTDLTFDPAESMQIARLRLGVDADGATTFVIVSTASAAGGLCII